MIPARFTDDQMNASDASPQPAAFFLMAVPHGAMALASPLEHLYQQIYEQAAKVSQPTPMAARDLFSIMN